MTDINIFDVMPGCKLIQCGDEVILAGIPPEVIKAVMLNRYPSPTALLIPDKIVLATNLQNCTEFPLYHFLFLSDGLQNNKKLKILGETKQVENNEDLLRLTLLGPTKEELLEIGTAEDTIEMFTKEGHYFNLKDESGNIYPITQFIENYIFNDDKQIDLGSVKVTHSGFNQYKIEYGSSEKVIDLNTTQAQIPPYPVQIDCTPNELCKFGIEILGGATGFSAANASSGLVIVYNGTYMLVDSIPFLDQHLIARGVAKNQITSIFLSHIHDDHCNLLPLMFSNNKVKIITTKEIYWMAMYKMSLMLDLPIHEIMNYFDLVPLTVGKTLDFYGLKIKPHYTIHTIPTVGARFFIQHNRQVYSVLITSDNQSLEDVDKMLKIGVIDKSRADKIKSLYQEEVELLLADGGEGLIHGNPRDAMESQASRVVFFHLDDLPLEFNATFSVATAGKRYVVIQGDCDFYTTRAIEFLVHHFYGMELSWISILMGNMSITRYNTDDVIIKQGAESRNKIYLILTGYCTIVVHDGVKPTIIARKEAGDLFGEMAITTGQRLRNASVVAQSPVTLCELSEEIFYALILKERFKDKLVERWDTRKVLEESDYFKDFPSRILERLAKRGALKEFAPQETVHMDSEDPYFYIIIHGRVKAPGDAHKTLSSGEFFGDFGFDSKYEETYVTQEKTSCLVFTKKTIQAILARTPYLLFVMKNRRYSNR